jgi:hypothetical protein
MTLFVDIDRHLEEHVERMRSRARFVAAMERSHWERELWQSIRPFLRSAEDHRAAAGFMAAMLRGRDRGE